MDDITKNVVVGYEHRDITACLRQVLQIQPPTTTDVLARFKHICWRVACWLSAIVTNMPAV